MNTMISRNFTLRLHSTHNHRFNFPSIPHKSPNHHNPFTQKCSKNPNIQSFCAATQSPSYGGWDLPRPISSGESNNSHSVLNSLGINDRKYVFVYVLGFVCAFAVSRVKVSTFIVIPVCMIVFVLGLTIGVVNGGRMSLNLSKKRSKDEIFRVPFEKLRSLVDVMSEFDAKILSLKSDVKKGIECNRITVGDLECLISDLDCVSSSAGNARSIVEGCIESVLVESRRKNDVGENRFSVPQFVAGLFQGNSDSKAKLSKVSTEDELKDRNILGSSAKDNKMDYISNEKVENSYQSSSKRTSFNQAVTSRSYTVADGNVNSPEMDFTVKSVFGSRQYGYSTNQTSYMRSEKVSLQNGYPNELRTWTSDEYSHDSMDFGVSMESTKTTASFSQEAEELEGNYSFFDGTKRNKEDTITHSRDRDSSSAFSDGSEDMMFSKYLSEANVLLKEAKDCLSQQGNDKIADEAFHRSAILLSKATEIRPMSSLAVGQLGNTYLLHGELKLRISRELRIQLTRMNPLSVDNWGVVENEQNDKVGRKEKLVSYLVDVCEECEGLLIKAGRQFRFALSIDGNDMRAMYNWGLALSFRAQLIADIGPGAARDADKVFLAAIDKFDAMMSKSNNYAPNALYRWGAALQQRSRLRPRNSREKLKLLQQARRLYEDALDMDSSNSQLKKALSSCISELNWYD